MATCARRSGKKEYEPQSTEDRQYCDCSQGHMGSDSIFTRAWVKTRNLGRWWCKLSKLGKGAVLTLAIRPCTAHIFGIAGLTFVGARG